MGTVRETYSTLKIIIFDHYDADYQNGDNADQVFGARGEQQRGKMGRLAWSGSEGVAWS